MQKIRGLQPHEIAQALRLIWEVFCEFDAPDYAPEGVATFQAYLKNRREIEKLRFYGALEGAALIGVIGMREEHISLFFVAKDWQGRGVGKALLHYAADRVSAGEMTVHAAPYARSIYQKLGFAARQEEQIADGLRYTPMTLRLPAERGACGVLLEEA